MARPRAIPGAFPERETPPPEAGDQISSGPRATDRLQSLNGARADGRARSADGGREVDGRLVESLDVDQQPPSIAAASPRRGDAG